MVRKLLLQLSFNMLVLISLLAQDTLNYELIANKEFAEEEKEWGAISAKFGMEIYNKYGRPPLPEERLPFRQAFLEKRNDKIMQKINNIDTCNESSVKYVVHRLKILEQKKGFGRNDAMVLMLINKLYELDYKLAVNFSLERWDKIYWANTNKNNAETDYFPRFAYLDIMYANMDISEFILVLLKDSTVDEKLIDYYMQSRRFRVDIDNQTRKDIYQYALFYLKVSKLDTYNEYFLSKLESIQ